MPIISTNDLAAEQNETTYRYEDGYMLHVDEYSHIEWLITTGLITTQQAHSVLSSLGDKQKGHRYYRLQCFMEKPALREVCQSGCQMFGWHFRLRRQCLLLPR